MSDTKREDYVPQFYLKRFENDDGFLRIYDKVDNEIFKRNSENICCERFMYETKWESANGTEKISCFLPLSPEVAVMFGNFSHLYNYRNQMLHLKKRTGDGIQSKDCEPVR